MKAFVVSIPQYDEYNVTVFSTREKAQDAIDAASSARPGPNLMLPKYEIDEQELDGGLPACS